MIRKLTHGIFRPLLICLSIAFSSSFAFSQSQASTGNIEGRVLDPQQAAVAGAGVTAVNQETGLEKTVNTDTEGNYRLILLPPGSYTVRATSAGFGATELKDVVVTVGGKTTLEIALSVTGASETVTVSGESTLIETTRTSVSSTIDQRAIENLPVNGRNYLDFATLTPGVIRDPTRAGDLSVGGQKGTLNSLQVDGTDNNNTFFGQSFGRTGTRPPYQFSEESVQEFQVNQNGFSAEFGRAGGAVINVVTKSGTNQFHGGGFEYFRDESLNSNTPILTARGRKRPPSQINQFGGRIGGPIKHDRAFFFFTYDGQRSTVPNVLDPPNFFSQPANIQSLLAPRLNTYEVGRNQDVFMAKGDIIINSKNQLSLRFNRQNFTGVNNENSGSLSAEEHSGNSIAKTTTFSGTLASTITQKMVNELRFQLARDREPGEANSDQPEARIQTGGGFLTIGRNNFSPRETTIKRGQIIDNVSYITGRHAFKFGADFNFDRILNFFPGLFSGQYTFNSYATFLSNTPAAYTQNFPGANTTGGTTHPNSSDYAGFAQDDWRLTPKLTLNLGVRYDYQGLAAPPIKNSNAALTAAALDTSTQPRDRNNFAPRLGFSYAPDEKTVFRGGYGIFYGRTTAIILGTAHSNNGINITGVNLTTPAQIAAAGLIYPNILSAPPASAGGVNPSLYLFDKDYVQPYVQQARFGIEREVLPNLSLAATYMFFRGDHLTRTRDINLFAPVATPAVALGGGSSSTVDRFPATRPLTSFARINLFESTSNSIYNGLALQATRRFARGLQFIAAYTFSKAQDDRPDQTAVVVGADDFKLVQNSLDPRADWGRADADVRHRLVLSPVYQLGEFSRSDNRVLRALLGGYTVSSIIQLQSGFAYSATVAADLNRDGNASNDRAPNTRRNQYTTPAIYQFDARLTKVIHITEGARLSLIAEGFNIFNRSNVSGVNTARYSGFTTNAAGALTLNPPSATSPFGGARFFLGERQVQLAVKFDF